MIIKNLNLENFRNHTQTQITFGTGINLITGPNGSGKTNLIDAVYYLCMSRSFTTSSDMYIVKQGASEFQIKACLEGQIRSSFTLNCHYKRGEGKTFSVNESPLDRLADLIGIVPVVALNPDDKRITNEGPLERRAFIDSMISQTSKSYLNDLIEYRRVVRQRNKLLSSASVHARNFDSLIEPWDAQLVNVGARIISKRIAVLSHFSSYLEVGYQKISGIQLKPSFIYKTICNVHLDLDEISKIFLKLLGDVREKEKERQMTLLGPHRDDLIFFLDNMELRKFGSQGQHRLFALSLKLAELNYFSDVLDDIPILILDDVFGDLDPNKVEVLTKMLLDHPGQCFVSAANDEIFEGLIPFDGEKNRRFTVKPNAYIEEHMI